MFFSRKTNNIDPELFDKNLYRIGRELREVVHGREYTQD